MIQFFANNKILNDEIKCYFKKQYLNYKLRKDQCRKKIEIKDIQEITQKHF